MRLNDSQSSTPRIVVWRGSLFCSHIHISEQWEGTTQGSMMMVRSFLFVVSFENSLIFFSFIVICNVDVRKKKCHSLSCCVIFVWKEYLNIHWAAARECSVYVFVRFLNFSVSNPSKEELSFKCSIIVAARLYMATWIWGNDSVLARCNCLKQILVFYF